MSHAARPPRVSIVMNFLHDGRVGLELAEERLRRSFDLRVVPVDDMEATAGVLRGWARDPLAPPRPRYELYRGFPSAEAFTVRLGAYPDPALDVVTEHADRLRLGFEHAFAPGGAAQDADVVAFADLLAPIMRDFVTTTRERSAQRFADSGQVVALEACLAELRAVTSIDDQDFHVRSGARIRSIVGEQQLLVLSADPRIRELGRQIRLEQEALYQWYMQLASGGHAFARRTSPVTA